MQKDKRFQPSAQTSRQGQWLPDVRASWPVSSTMHVEPVKAASHSHHKGEILHIKLISNGMKLIHPDLNEVWTILNII